MRIPIKKIQKKLTNLFHIDNRLHGLERVIVRESDIQKMLLGKLLVNDLMRRKDSIQNIQEAEFKVFSQWGDDGIIQYLINTIQIPVKKLVEFGVGDYTEANTRFLLLNDNWSGLVMDNVKEAIDSIRSSSIYPLYDLTAKEIFATTDNINETIASAGFKGEIGVLHIDIDGNDYWVWKALTVVSPIIAILEYNPYFGADRPIVVTYEKDFNRTKYHHSWMYYGASLSSLCDLAEEKGYAFIGTNSNGGNAYFIRKDKLGKLKPLTSKEGYTPTKSREHRDTQGKLTFTPPLEGVESIRGLPVFNTRTNKSEPF